MNAPNATAQAGRILDMTDDFTHKLLFEQWDHEHINSTPVFCDDPDCIVPDPCHSPDECCTVEMAEEYHKEGMRTSDEYHKEGMRTSDEYKLALTEVLQRIGNDLKVLSVAENHAPLHSHAIGSRKYANELKNWLEEQLES